jgi:hypothetical protein
MFSAGMTIHLWVPAVHKSRVLIRGCIDEVGDGGTTVVARFEEQVSPEVNSDVQLYVEFRGKFFQQGARVVEILDAGEQPQLKFTRVGDPVSAESRGSYRVSTAAAQIKAKIAKRAGAFSVVDVSPEGFAIILNDAPLCGSMLEVNWDFEGVKVEGSARVQTIKPLPNGTFRVGLLAADKQSPMRRSLERLSIALQRAQLRRLSGAA